MAILDKNFYQRKEVVQIAYELIGKVLYTRSEGIVTAGVITETEAYAGIDDKASHAYNSKRTKRNEAMYDEGGTSYVFICYGIHHLFNVVTNIKEVPHAVLIRAIQPYLGIETMMKRRNKKKLDKKFSAGPGTMSQALGIQPKHNGIKLINDQIWIEDHQLKIEPEKIECTPRIGIDYAEEDALLPYRYLYKGVVNS